MDPAGRTVALVNRGARTLGSPEACQTLAHRLRETLGAETVFTGPEDDVTQLARVQRDQGARLIVAAGGDGTVSAVAEAVAGTGAVMGILPLGTLNHFARDLGIPDALDDAIQVLANPAVTTVDCAEVNGRIFVNNSGLGLYPTTLALREQKQQEAGWRKWPAHLWAALKALARYRMLTILVEAGGRALVRTTPMVFIGNNDYRMQGLQLGSRTRMNGGKLCLVIPHRTGRLRLLWFSLRALFGRRYPGTELDHIHTDSLRIESGHHRLRVALDGELTRLETPLTYRILPGALRVAVPPAVAA